MVEYPKALRLIDIADESLVRWGLLKPASWADAAASGKLYAGKLRRGLPQYDGYIGLTPFAPSKRNIPHDILDPIPLKGEISVYQSEDVFEHLPYEVVPRILDYVHDALKPSGFFRLSVPDYRADIYNMRCIYDGDRIVFDPGGGGDFVNGEVVKGGHLWFPVYETLTAAIEASKFDKYNVLEGYDPKGRPIMQDIDYTRGFVQRSSRDPRVSDNPRPLSLIVDLVK